MDQRNCKGCFQADRCREVWSESPKGTLNPVGLSLAAMLAFLLPLTAAIVAGVAGHIYFAQQEKTKLWEIAAATAGLLIGALLAWLLMPSLRKHFDKSKP